VPTYAYACTDCGQDLEVVQSFTDESLTECPECEGRLRKVFSTVGVVFKGSGFYRNDSRGPEKTSSDQSSGEKSSGEKSSGDKSSSDKPSTDKPSGDKPSGKESRAGKKPDKVGASSSAANGSTSRSGAGSAA
jgi:putative FmdB family regulatory protein